MSEREARLIRGYWGEIGGTLVEEYLAVSHTKNSGRRLIDAVIILGGENIIARWRNVSLKGKDIICVQAKEGRLGMHLMGQTFFSAQLLERFEPASIHSVALCTQDDSELRPLLEQYPNMEVRVINP